MKKVFIYGDSNVWGANNSGDRVPTKQRWPAQLQSLLGDQFKVLVNGVPGRISGDYRQDKPEKNGQRYFEAAHNEITPVDIVIIALGTNDLQQKYHQTSEAIIDNLLWYKSKIGRAHLIYLLPPRFETSEASGPEFTHNSLELRNKLTQHQDALGDCVVINDVKLSDGLHFSPAGHLEVAKIMYEKLKATKTNA